MSKKQNMKQKKSGFKDCVLYFSYKPIKKSNKQKKINLAKEDCSLVYFSFSQKRNAGEMILFYEMESVLHVLYITQDEVECVRLESFFKESSKPSDSVAHF